jgi:hypothetical protein
VQSCISLKRMTEVFKKYDDDRDGYVTLKIDSVRNGQHADWHRYITLSFEEFLTGKPRPAVIAPPMLPFPLKANSRSVSFPVL